MDNFEKEKYLKLVDTVSPNSKLFSNCLKAFFVGGAICTFAEFLNQYLTSLDFSKDDVSLIVNMVLIGITAILTGTGLFSRIGKFSGAGTFVPITGFANSITSCAIEFKKEGWILGLSAKIFIVAGPVIVYGLLSSVVVGFIYFFLSKIS
ncbi:MAG: SpoVA/SpoVAEb family sporulation membrane protein [Anaerotignaceae bacterium]